MRPALTQSILLAFGLCLGTCAATASPLEMTKGAAQAERPSREAVQPATVTHGVAAGDVTTDSVVIWSRSDREATMHVQLIGPVQGPNLRRVDVSAARDFTGKIVFDGLKPDTAYRYRVWFGDPGTAETGAFHTAPAADSPQAVRLVWGGDLAGQNVCRDAERGFPVFEAINAARPDLFIGLGDMIYADGVCEAVGRYGNRQIAGDFQQSADIETFWAHWKYNREDEGLRDLLARTSYYAIWDDHEVVNDFGPLHDTRDVAPYTPDASLLPLGLAALLDYNPIREDALTPKRLYRNVRWGQHLELFFLDNRQYRDANLASDSPDRPKTMLGREQTTWLKEKLTGSDATWKVVVSSVPMSIPTGFPPERGRDGWADFDQDTGFEQELKDILASLREAGEDNVVFITTDVHFAEAFRYTPFAADPAFQIHEFVTGPLNAGLFPNRNFDTDLGTESLFFYGPESADVASYDEALPWMNYGMAEIAPDGSLSLSIHDVQGSSVYQLDLQP